MDYWSGLSAIVGIKYSSSSGQPFVHLPKEPAYPPIYPNAWNFHWINKWRDQFDKVVCTFLKINQHFRNSTYPFLQFEVILWSLEAGLIEKWKRMTWEKMIIDFETMREISIYERPEVDILTLDDTKSAFYLFILTTIISIIVAIVECIIAKVWYRPDGKGRVNAIPGQLGHDEENSKEDMRAVEVN